MRLLIVSLFGGLGNQMFQYACGRSLSIEMNLNLKLDLSILKNYDESSGDTKRYYELDCFNIQEEIASIQECKRFLPVNKPNAFIYKLYSLKRFLFCRYLYEESELYNFEEQILNIKNKQIYLKGYFQSEKYFHLHEKQIRKDFQIRDNLSQFSRDILNNIREKITCSIHVRRGDYLTNANALKYHNICDIAYYMDAIYFISSKCDIVTYLIFSDDIEWVKNNLYLFPKNSILINGETNRMSYEDMILMSNCTHHIIANSSYSWWGAWLNPRIDKLVIAPKKWIKNEADNDKINDLLPGNWFKI